MKLSNIEIKEIKELFIKLASTDNPSGKEEKIVELVIHELGKLGIVPQVDEFHNVFFQVEGKGTPLFLNAHLDSVNPCIGKEIGFEDGVFFSKGNTVLGADDLEGVAIILSIVSYFKKHKIAHRPLDILFTAQEEVGGIGIKNFDLSRLKAKDGLVLDSGSKVGDFVVKSPAKYNFKFFIKGIAGHSGHAKKTFSAIIMMADILYHLPIGQIDEFTRLNIGQIEGGKSINTVPGDAHIDGSISVFGNGEIRGVSSTCKKVIAKIKNIIDLVEKKYPLGKVSFEYEEVRPSYSLDEEDDFLKTIDEAIFKSEMTPKRIKSNGVSDANLLHSSGYNGVLMGTSAIGIHTIDEKLALNDMVKLMEITMLVCTNGK